MANAYVFDRVIDSVNVVHYDRWEENTQKTLQRIRFSQ